MDRYIDITDQIQIITICPPAVTRCIFNYSDSVCRPHAVSPSLSVLKLCLTYTVPTHTHTQYVIYRGFPVCLENVPVSEQLPAEMLDRLQQDKVD